jgi:hypothetical protein
LKEELPYFALDFSFAEKRPELNQGEGESCRELRCISAEK